MISLPALSRGSGFSLRPFVYAWPVLVMFLLGGAFFCETAIDLLTADKPGTMILQGVEKVYVKFYTKMANDPFFYVGIPLIFLLQILLPVVRSQTAFGPSTRVDLAFTLLMLGFYALAAPSFQHFCHYLYDQYFWYLALPTKIEFSTEFQFLLGYLAIDFVGWLHHLVRHKVPIFWEFHTVHHSQRAMNPFTNERLHPFDWLFANSIKFIPVYFFATSFQIALGYIVIHRFLDHLNHSNVRTNLGWLRYIFVTPQSHRVHHSRLPEHADCNFGVSLSIWDHIFGTQYRNCQVYPETGVDGFNYPLELEGSMKGVFLSIKDQLLVPFQIVWQHCLSLMPTKH